MLKEQTISVADIAKRLGITRTTFYQYFPAAPPGRGCMMPIRPQLRWLYPIDWPQLSALIRFDRSKGRCEGCGRRMARSCTTWVTADGTTRSGRCGVVGGAGRCPGAPQCRTEP